MGKQDLDIARTVTLKPIQEIGAAVGLTPAELGALRAPQGQGQLVRHRAAPRPTPTARSCW